MPMIQIEQDSPQVIKRVRQKIADLAQEHKQYPTRDIHSSVMFVVGYTGALLMEDVISAEMHRQLSRERDEALAQAECEG